MSDRTVKVTLDQLKDWEDKLMHAFLEMTDGVDSPENTTDAMLNVARVRQSIEQAVCEKIFEPFID